MDATKSDPTMDPLEPDPDTDLDLRGFVKLNWGNAARLAEAMDISAVLISQWAKGNRPVPPERAVAIEWHTGFKVRVERLWCPDVRWQRVPDPDWPHGKPLIDTSPRAANQQQFLMNPQPPFVDTQPESA